jgi:hypothetical protein
MFRSMQLYKPNKSSWLVIDKEETDRIEAALVDRERLIEGNAALFRIVDNLHVEFCHVFPESKKVEVGT